MAGFADAKRQPTNVDERALGGWLIRRLTGRSWHKAPFEDPIPKQPVGSGWFPVAWRARIE
jgi:hypothetical protein